jgi:hypothetical protein
MSSLLGAAEELSSADWVLHRLNQRREMLKVRTLPQRCVNFQSIAVFDTH